MNNEQLKKIQSIYSNYLFDKDEECAYKCLCENFIELPTLACNTEEDVVELNKKHDYVIGTASKVKCLTFENKPAEVFKFIKFCYRDDEGKLEKLPLIFWKQ